MQSDFKQLRKKFDGSESFMNRGHQIIKSAGATRHAERVSKTPDWVHDDQRVRELLLRSFPKLATDPLQRKRAGRWMQVIQLYFRMGWTWAKIAEEMGESPRKIESTIQKIYNVAAGRRSDGKQRSVRSPGRPKNIDVTKL